MPPNTKLLQRLLAKFNPFSPLSLRSPPPTMPSNTKLLQRLLGKCYDMKTNMLDMQTKVGRLDLTVAAMKTDMADMKTKVDRLEHNMADMKTDMADMKTKVDRLDLKVDRLELRVGMLMEAHVRKVVAQERGEEWTRHYNTYALDGITNLLIAPNASENVSFHVNDMTNKLVLAALKGADGGLPGLLQCIAEDYQLADPPAFAATVDFFEQALAFVTAALQAEATRQHGQDATKRGILIELQRLLEANKDIVQTGSEDLTPLFKIIRTNSGLALSLFFAMPPLLAVRKNLPKYKKRWAWRSLEFDMRGKFTAPSAHQAARIEFGEVKSSAANQGAGLEQLAFRSHVLRHAYSIMAPNNVLECAPVLYIECASVEEDTVLKENVPVCIIPLRGPFERDADANDDALHAAAPAVAVA
ncbi:uncharacterized protein MONBRDRAFT_8393 [Monosiga brevicollis MX1]|uniref:Uncharacterized protein n=1 Tax=Monosiga brevicollis TaxID=81824 RepID=A9UZX4_MONBE|nr:uncharacterized protein MONBRDRAFT_8393 [Monosiga brevicollis MX1]EDQ88916.1 predicted protein [Monosiga brevicollis MX1]|eukprot:XP_001746021.1 hypothetical protein [Monosiga brevicollis MX1]